MTRNSKALGLAFAAMLVVGSIAASSASAAPRLTPVPEEYPVILKGSQSTAYEFTLPGGRVFKCATATYIGEGGKAAAEAGEVVMTPSFSGCSAVILGNIVPMTVTMNGCAYAVTTESETSGSIKEEGWEVTGSMHVKCPAGKVIEFHVWQNAEKHANGEPALCTYTTAPQGPISSLDFKLEEKNGEGAGTSGTVRDTLTGIKVTRTGGTLLTCGAVNQEASATGDTKTESFNSKGEMLRSKWDLP